MRNIINNISYFLAVERRLTTSGQPTEAQLRALAEAGCEVVINLALHDNPRYSLPDEPGSVESLGMEYVHIPVQFDAPTEADLLAFFDTMETNRKKRLHVHCAANRRVTAFLGLYRVIREKRGVEDAFAPMQSIWEPDEIWAGFISDRLEKYTG